MRLLPLFFFVLLLSGCVFGNNGEPYPGVTGDTTGGNTTGGGDGNYLLDVDVHCTSNDQSLSVFVRNAGELDPVIKAQFAENVGPGFNVFADDIVRPATTDTQRIFTGPNVTVIIWRHQTSASGLFTATFSYGSEKWVGTCDSTGFNADFIPNNN